MLPYNNGISTEDVASLLAVLKSGEYDGKSVLVCWHHTNIPQFLDALGASSATLLGINGWPNNVFGWLVELRFDANGALANAVIVNEHLMDDDKKKKPPAAH